MQAGKTWHVYYFERKKVLQLNLKESIEGFCQGKGKVIEKDRKGAGTNSVKSGKRNLEAESIRTRAHPAHRYVWCWCNVAWSNKY